MSIIDGVKNVFKFNDDYDYEDDDDYGYDYEDDDYDDKSYSRRSCFRVIKNMTMMMRKTEDAQRARWFLLRQEDTEVLKLL